MGRKNKKRILFVYKKLTTFVLVDLDLLKEKYFVTTYHFKQSSNFLVIFWSFFKLSTFLIFRLRQFDYIYSRFADYHSFIPVLFTKYFNIRTLIVNGGFDVNSQPEINYGATLSPARKKIVQFILKHATYCLPVTKELEEKIRKLAPEAKVKTIFNGYDHHKWTINKYERPIMALTVSITNDEMRYYVKGLDRFIELAANFPNERFLIVGTSHSFLNEITEVPQNVELLPPLDQLRLKEIYNQSIFYAQLSRSEGFPNAVCESMLCGCIPVGMNVGAMERIIGENGLVLDEWNVRKILEYINQVDNETELSINARKHVVDNFAIERRKKAFYDLIDRN